MAADLHWVQLLTFAPLMADLTDWKSQLEGERRSWLRRFLPAGLTLGVTVDWIVLHVLEIGVVLYLGWCLAVILAILRLFQFHRRSSGAHRIEVSRPPEPRPFTAASGDEY